MLKLFLKIEMSALTAANLKDLAVSRGLGGRGPSWSPPKPRNWPRKSRS